MSSMRPVAKAETGIAGFDEITGGLPRGRTTLVEGGPGSGKTVFALQSLRHGIELGEPALFVAFEEDPERIVSNVAAFGWDLSAIRDKQLFFMDGRPSLDLVYAGDFDLTGLLATLDAWVADTGARRIVFDALDILLLLLPDAASQRREAYRLQDWLLERSLTAMITAKASHDKTAAAYQGEEVFSFMQFMVDCSVFFSHRLVHGVSQRSLRVLKYRGSGFEENEFPFVISADGFQVADAGTPDGRLVAAPDERISTGVERLDTMLNGGYYRGASILVTGFPGTAKTTLAGAFVQAACERGEHALFISFDSDVDELIRNLASVDIRLERFRKKKLLRLVCARGLNSSAEIHLMHIKEMAREHNARCLVIDPVSALAKAGNLDLAHSVAERLIDWSKREGITLLCTSLLDEVAPNTESTPLQVSTIADTWIHLNYLVHAGERNRGLSIVKSRGTSHSNQVRELVLSDKGVTLADAYTAGGEVLMGTLRWEKEQAEQRARERETIAARREQETMDAEIEQLELRLKSLQRELEGRKSQRSLLDNAEIEREQAFSRDHQARRDLRGEGAKGGSGGKTPAGTRGKKK